MSRHNKVNPDHYKVAGRLSTDDLARERRNQSSSRLASLRDGPTKPMPPWMTRRDEPRTEEHAEPAPPPAPVEPPKARRSRKPVARTRSGAAATKTTAKRKAKTTTKAKAKAKAKAKTAKGATRKAAKKRTAPSRRR